MRMYEIMKPIEMVALKRPDDPDRKEELAAKARAAIEKARQKTLAAAQKYQDQMNADDDAEREAEKRL